MNIDRRMSQQKLEELGDLIYKIRQYAELKKDVELYVMADRANGEMRNLAAALDSEDRPKATNSDTWDTHKDTFECSACHERFERKPDVSASREFAGSREKQAQA